MVISTTERTYYSNGKPYTVIVSIKDDAYRDCSEEELRRRREEFGKTALRIAGDALKNRGSDKQ